MEKQSATFCNGIYSVLDNFHYAEFSAYYLLERKSSKACEYWLHELHDNLIENNHKDCSFSQ